MTEDKKVYQGIDTFKLVAAVCVVVLHAVENSSWFPSEVKFVFTRFAVPFFFVVSGFFFYKGLDKACSKMKYFKKYLKHIVKIFIIWALIIYTPFVLTTYLNKYHDNSLWRICLYLIRRIFIIGPGPYWYLIALGWSAIFLYYCYMKKNDIILYAAIVIGLFLEICYSCFNGILSEYKVFEYLFKGIYFAFSWEFNFITFGIPFMGIGYIIAKKKISCTVKPLCVVFAVATIIRIVEFNMPIIIKSDFWNNNQISFMFIVQAISFFLIAKEIKIDISRENSLKLRQLSSCIYFSHAIFMYNFINPILLKYTDVPVYADGFIIPKIILTLSLCLLLFIIIKRINNRHLTILING